MKEIVDKLDFTKIYVCSREGGLKGRGHMYTYGRSTWMYDRNQHNIVIILQLKINFKKI